jgi:predicted permease
MLAAGPCGAMPFVVALQYKVQTETISKAILISTLVGVVSLAWLSRSLR